MGAGCCTSNSYVGKQEWTRTILLKQEVWASQVRPCQSNVCLKYRNGSVTICSSGIYTFPCGETRCVCTTVRPLPHPQQMLPSERFLSEAPETSIRQLEGNWLFVRGEGCSIKRQAYLIQSAADLLLALCSGKGMDARVEWSCDVMMSLTCSSLIVIHLIKFSLSRLSLPSTYSDTVITVSDTVTLMFVSCYL